MEKSRMKVVRPQLSSYSYFWQAWKILLLAFLFLAWHAVLTAIISDLTWQENHMLDSSYCSPFHGEHGEVPRDISSKDAPWSTSKFLTRENPVKKQMKNSTHQAKE